MNRNITLKLLTITGLAILLLIPLLWVGDIIRERSNYKSAAVHEVTSSWTGQQLITGPFIIQPYSLKTKAVIYNKVSKEYEPSFKTEHKELLMLPEQLNVTGDVATQTRKRGIYEVPVYTAELFIDGQFNNQALLDLKTKHGDFVQFKAAIVITGIEDMRGIKGLPKLNLGKKSYALKPGTNNQYLSNGLHALIPALNADELEKITFASSLALKGASNLSVLPLGSVSDIQLKSDWQHPSFQGYHLPEQHAINKQGFAANWSTSPYSNDTRSLMQKCVQQGKCNLRSYALGVDLLQPVDAYVQTERSTKYGLLFIAITFAAFFLFEVLKQLSIHPIQYTMVGLSLALFFLLLVSLSEHIAFGIAYLFSALSCIGLLSYYITAILGSRKRGLGFAAGLSALYGFIYIIISSEDFALMMGAILLFSALGSVMLLTRNIDWYQLTKKAVKPSTQQELSL